MDNLSNCQLIQMALKKKKANYTKNKLTNQSGRSIVRNMKRVSRNIDQKDV